MSHDVRVLAQAHGHRVEHVLAVEPQLHGGRIDDGRPLDEVGDRLGGTRAAGNTRKRESLERPVTRRKRHDLQLRLSRVAVVRQHQIGVAGGKAEHDGGDDRLPVRENPQSARGLFPPQRARPAGSIPHVPGKPGRVVVTGGAGFIGSHVADAFLADGATVLVIDDLSTGLEANVPAAAELQRVDIVDARQLREALDGFNPDVVCHLAAQASVTVSVERPEHDLEVNVRGTLIVCEAARAAGAPVVFASTGGAIYGNDAPLPTPESFPPAPLAPYGASKLAGEAYVATWGRLHGLPNVVLRLGNVYGPRQQPHGEAGVVAIFSNRLARGEQLVVYGFGEPTRDYVHVSDVARAFATAASAGRSGTFNVGTARETSVLELLEILQREAGTGVQPELMPLRPGELERSALDPSATERELGWRAEIAVEQGLPETFREFVPSA